MQKYFTPSVAKYSFAQLELIIKVHIKDVDLETEVSLQLDIDSPDEASRRACQLGSTLYSNFRRTAQLHIWSYRIIVPKTILVHLNMDYVTS